MFTASLENSRAKDTFFLPVIDSTSLYCFIFPPGIRKNLLLQAYFSPGIFKISGIINNLKKQTAVKAILITDNEKVFNKELALQDGNRFTLPPLVFENKASLIFNYVKQNKWKDHPDIVLTTTPAVADFTNFIFSDTVKRADEHKNYLPGNENILNDSTEKGTTADDKYKMLNEIKVTGVKKSSIQKFNEAYSSGLFKSSSERVIDCIDNGDILSYPDCLSFLQSQIPGLRMSADNPAEMTIVWRGNEMKAFYIDEIAVDIEQMLGMNTADIAMIKVYPPPFFGSSAGGGGAIAVYTRRGEYRTVKASDKKWLFTVKGYAEPVYVLFAREK